MSDLANLNDAEKNLLLQRVAQKGNQLNFYTRKNFSNGNHPQKRLNNYATSTYGASAVNGGYGLSLRRALNLSFPFKQYQVTNAANKNVLTNNVTTLNGDQFLGYGYVQQGNNGGVNIFV
jgi:hypothetical protein